MTTVSAEAKVQTGKVKPAKRRLSIKSKQGLTGLLFISPWIIGFLAFVAYPLYRTVFMSFHNVSFGLKTGWRYKWVGMDNYSRILLEEIDFVIEAQNFFVSTLLYVPVIIALSVIIALLLNRKIKGTSLYRLLFFLPILILNGELMDNMSTYGGMSIAANRFILETLLMIIPSSHAVMLIVDLFELIVQLLWYSAVPILIFLAALQKISKDMYEAASIDGASPWTSFWKITLPMIYPLVSVCVVYVVVFLANFEANPINTIIMESKYDGSRREGYASALAILYSAVQILLIAILYYATRSRSSKGR
ncbi:ABC transporter permease [Paenibacillus sp. 32O-W]|jgi:ABC-type sugar transport system permease subunit|uniref:ABC transporter permease n=2 Tax=Paenibacillus cisolokensis TaxID=1658519 RepID=A0ABQ4NBW1_9BACL|nr:ABC transporter permease [Paenibacillus sp. 32O-W]GIQ65715.1 ABC transporter permease [Paenibacillus cisolokensis]